MLLVTLWFVALLAALAVPMSTMLFSGMEPVAQGDLYPKSLKRQDAWYRSAWNLSHLYSRRVMFAAGKGGRTKRKYQVGRITGELKLPVIYRLDNGYWVRRKVPVIIHNPLLKHFLPHLWEMHEYPLVVIDWGDDLTAAELRKPVEWKGVLYDGSWFAGSSIKKGRTVGIAKDMDVSMIRYLLSTGEMSIKMSRAFIPDSLYGAYAFSKFKIMNFNNGELFNGLPIEDGAAYMPESVYKLILDEMRDAIELGISANNAQLWQHMRWEPIKDEVEQMVIARMKHIKKYKVGLPKWKRIMLAPGMERYVALNETMLRHPLVTNSYDNNAARFFSEWATTIPFKFQGAVAIPCPRDMTHTITTNEGDGVAIARYPIASTLGLLALEGGQEWPLMKQFIEAAQITLTNFDAKRQFSLKGLVIVVPDHMIPKGVGLVTSFDNWKLWRKPYDAEVGTKPRMPKVMTLNDVGIGIVNRYAPENLVGINAEIFKKMAGDFDGDYLFWTIMSLLSTIYLEIMYQNQKPANSLKVAKSNSYPLESPLILENAFLASIGYATNLRHMIYAMNDQQRDVFAADVEDLCLGLYRKLGETPPEVWNGVMLEVFFSWLIQTIVDSFKSRHAKMRIVNSFLGKFSTRVTTKYGQMSGHLKWKNSAEAWTVMRPLKYTDVPNYLWDAARSSDEVKRSLRIHMDNTTHTGGWTLLEGTIGSIFDLTYESQGIIWDKFLKESGAEEALPLSFFYAWGPPVEKTLVDKHCDPLFVLWAEYNAALDVAKAEGTLDTKDPESIRVHDEIWRDTIREYAKDHFKGDMNQMFALLWRVCHNSKTALASAEMVFRAFPKQCEVVVAANDGQSASRCYVVGIRNNFDVVPTDPFEADVVVYEKNGKFYIATEDLLDHQIVNADVRYTPLHIGVCVIPEKKHLQATTGTEYLVPSSGRYHATFVPMSESAFDVTFDVL